MLSKCVFFVIFLLIANGAMGQTGQIEINAPWARATPGHVESGAVYSTIVSPTTDRLTAASSPVAKKVELHTMSMEGGVMRIDHFEQLDLAWPDGAIRIEVNAECEPRYGPAPAASGESARPLFAIFHFGASAEGWNSCSPSTLYPPIAACPSGDSSHSAKRRAKACFGTGCFAGFNRITS
jgi:hypothetical protein